MIFSWVIIIVFSYLFFALAAFGDKLVLSGSPNQKSYAFYVGVLGICVVFLIPFAGLGLPALPVLAWIFLDALAYILAIYTMFSALETFDVSRVVPAIGAVQPIFTFIITWLLFGPQVFQPIHMLAFAILLVGGFVISMGKTFSIHGRYLKLTLFSSLMFSCDYVFSKMVFLHMPFLQGLIWIRIFCFGLALLLLFDKKLRQEVFSRHHMVKPKTQLFILSAQASGAVAGILQSLAIAIVPVSYLAIMNALRGVQYVFLFLITLGFSWLFPRLLKEEFSQRAIIQKVCSIVLIFIGLAMLFLN